ncbi:hypothetical protein, partial [Porphyromonas gulae]|uniref:hypothetical protein n=1 Tax=Porphyromonas gulae TaxID=111105 RepID=UPI001F455D2A
RQTILTEEIVQSCSEYRLSQKASKHLMRLPWVFCTNLYFSYLCSVFDDSWPPASGGRCDGKLGQD